MKANLNLITNFLLLIFLSIGEASAMRPPFPCSNVIPQSMYPSIESTTTPPLLVLAIAVVIVILMILTALRAAFFLWAAPMRFRNVKMVSLMLTIFLLIAFQIVVYLAGGLLGVYDHDCRFCPTNFVYRMFLLLVPLLMTGALFLVLIRLINKLISFRKFPLILLSLAAYLPVWLMAANMINGAYSAEKCISGL